MANFKRKQSAVQAVQFVDGRYGEAIDFCPQLDVSFGFTADKQNPTATSRAVNRARIDQTAVTPGDWIVNDDGAYRVMSDEDFRAEFDPA